MNSDTPRTDVALCYGTHEWKEFARTLERELMRAIAEHNREALNACQLRRELAVANEFRANAEAERDALRAALERVQWAWPAEHYESACPNCGMTPSLGHTDRCYIGAALAFARKQP